MTSEQQTNVEPVQLPMAPSTVRAAAQSEAVRLNTFVQQLPLEAWTEGSAVKGWTIGDVVAHLNLALGAYGRLLEAVHAGKGAGSLSRALGRVTRTVSQVGGPAYHSLNSALPRLIDRALAPEVIKGQFAAGTRRLEERLQRIEPQDYTRPVYWFGDPWPLSFFLAMVVNELAIHGWDMESRRDAQAHLSEAARAVLPWFYWSGSPFMLQPAKGTTGAVQVELRDPDSEVWWDLTASGRRQGLGRTPEPATTIRGAAGIFVLVLAGRIPVADALAQTSLRADGNTELARTFLAGWKIL